LALFLTGVSASIPLGYGASVAADKLFGDKINYFPDEYKLPYHHDQFLKNIALFIPRFIKGTLSEWVNAVKNIWHFRGGYYEPAYTEPAYNETISRWEEVKPNLYADKFFNNKTLPQPILKWVNNTIFHPEVNHSAKFHFLKFGRDLFSSAVKAAPLLYYEFGAARDAINYASSIYSGLHPAAGIGMMIGYFAYRQIYVLPKVSTMNFVIDLGLHVFQTLADICYHGFGIVHYDVVEPYVLQHVGNYFKSLWDRSRIKIIVTPEINKTSQGNLTGNFTQDETFDDYNSIGKTRIKPIAPRVEYIHDGVTLLQNVAQDLFCTLPKNIILWGYNHPVAAVIIAMGAWEYRASWFNLLTEKNNKIKDLTNLLRGLGTVRVPEGKTIYDVSISDWRQLITKVVKLIYESEERLTCLETLFNPEPYLIDFNKIQTRFIKIGITEFLETLNLNPDILRAARDAGNSAIRSSIYH